jgi:hypothetical protein
MLNPFSFGSWLSVSPALPVSGGRFDLPHNLLSGSRADLLQNFFGSDSFLLAAVTPDPVGRREFGRVRAPLTNHPPLAGLLMIRPRGRMLNL